MAQSNLSICLNKGQLNKCYGLSSIASFFNTPNPLFHTDFMGTFNNFVILSIVMKFSILLQFFKAFVYQATCTKISKDYPYYDSFQTTLPQF